MLYDEIYTKDLLRKSEKSNDNNLTPLKIIADNNSTQEGIKIKSLNARWNKESTDLSLENINLHTYPGKLLAVIGPVGSGKTSLFQAILGELQSESGSIEVNGTVSYASQEP